MLNTLQKGQGDGDVKKIKVEGERDKGKEVIVHYETAPPKWRKVNMGLT